MHSIKSTLIQTHYFTIKNAFKAIDDWNAKWIDHNNLKRFLTNMGFHVSKKSKKSLVNKFKTSEVVHAIIRRIDLNGSGQISLSEFKKLF